MRDYTRHTEETTFTAQSPEPPTDFEYKQAHHAWRQLIGSANGETIGLQWRIRELARTPFIFGWAACARSGIASPALTDVPISPESVVSFFRKVKIELGTRPTPRLGQEVRYHGSVRRFQGAYFWIMGITETADSEAQAQALYTLGRWTGRGYRRVLSDVHRSSITPLDCFHEVKWIR
ncbi:hypothetical protein ACFV42_42445 [Streptomyces solisilvae]|uniref:hypothetical protein n=1 Tax=Streptomyces malaysiensis TaxID=92644 RepID=UPI0036A2DB63